MQLKLFILFDRCAWAPTYLLLYHPLNCKMCLQGIKQQIFDHLNKNEFMNNESYDFVDHCDYLELENIIPKTIPRDNLNVLQMNVWELVGKQNKLQSLLDNLENYSNIHCLLLCETWLTEDTK